MQDRISQDPGRYLVTPDDGSPAFYAHLTLADNPVQQGTPLSKENLLKDQTAQQLGLQLPGATVDEALAMIQLLNSNADIFDLTNKNTFNDALEWFRQYTLHYWRKRTVGDYWEENMDHTDANILLHGGSNLVRVRGSTTLTYTIQYSDSVTISSDGVVMLQTPIKQAVFTATKHDSNIAEFNSILFNKYAEIHKYVDDPPLGITKIESDKTFTYSFSNSSSEGWLKLPNAIVSGYAFNLYKVNAVKKTGISPWKYVTDTDVNAHPKYGKTGTTEWDYIGIPFERIKQQFPRVTTITYKGTGTSDPAIISAPFPIKFLVLVHAQFTTDCDNPIASFLVFASDSIHTSYGKRDEPTLELKDNRCTMYITHSSSLAKMHFNEQNAEYTAFILG